MNNKYVLQYRWKVIEDMLILLYIKSDPENGLDITKDDLNKEIALNHNLYEYMENR